MKRFVSRVAGASVPVLLLLLVALLAFAPEAGASFANPAAVTMGSFTAVKATSSAASVNSSISAPRAVHLLQIQNQCASDVAIQFNGVTAVFGQAYLIPAGQTMTWKASDGPIPRGPYSLITASATCSPDTNTGLVIMEMP